MSETSLDLDIHLQSTIQNPKLALSVVEVSKIPMSDTPSLISPTPIATEYPPLTLGIMASGSGSNFEAVAAAIADGSLNARIAVLIYSKPGIQAIDKAAARGIPAILLDAKLYPDRAELDREIVKTMQAHQVNCVVMAGWMRVVTQVLIDAFPDRLINIHPSLLPSFPGIRAIEQALVAGVKISGCTVHLVSLAVDSGPIIIQAAVPVFPDDTPNTLHLRIQAQEHKILPQAIEILSQRVGFCM
jgi:phosphoribosylglycinamide formyltransferase 1